MGYVSPDKESLLADFQEVYGSEKLTEEHLPQLPCLNAIFHETLHKCSPVPIMPPRYAHEDTQLGGYNIPTGTDNDYKILVLMHNFKFGLLSTCMAATWIKRNGISLKNRGLIDF
ncbi:hypothetical protein H6P81_000195 [Aristolochia fimbriata]|uniref:Cytochrome P450 n=1 Tax=Aristolochia fimbriata TaxID=158543 RepID=A0AAV7F7C8_ARIFI|nr:hypothetical protein H6P81_000195 [Aristolochia fimbriata]